MQEREQLRALGFAGAVERLGRCVQKLVGESARERFEHLLRRRPASEQTARTVELGDAKLVMMSLQRSDRRHYRPAFEPAQKTRGLIGDPGFGFAHCLDPDLQIVLDDVGQVVDGIQEHVVELGSFRFDVARHRQVDDEHRRMAPGLDRALEHALAEDGQRACGGGNNDVELRKTLGQLGESDRVGRKARRELRAALQGTVGDGDGFRRSRGEMRCGKIDHVAGPDQKHALLGDRRKNALRQSHRGGSHGNRGAADIGVGAHILGHGKRALEEPVQHQPERTRGLGGLYRLFHLSENLRLAKHHRVKAAGDAKRVRHRFVLRQGVKVG